VTFSHVIESARAFLVAVLAREIPQTLWVICPSVRTQELLHESLTNWLPEALFLPEAEFFGVENILPDQEIAAERLALLAGLRKVGSPTSSLRLAPALIRGRRNVARSGRPR
jgi:transcription-repair coupling factor (superfamily II helicase)